MSLLVWLSFCSLFAGVFSCEAYIKTNQLSDRSVIVQMFEWTWLDIAAECENFLGPNKYGAVQTSPATENVIVRLNTTRPWYERYQPISYKLTTRSGDEAAFLNMTTRCNKVGVRIYVDVVFNHMTGSHNESIGTGGSVATTQNNSYPGVPYTDEHFHHPECEISDYNNATEIRVCQLSGLKDLNQTIPYVRQKIIDYLNNLIDLGAAGIRVDAAKHMWPEDLNEIYKNLHNLNTNHGFRRNSRPYIYQEVAKDGVVTYNDYKDMGDITEFTAGNEIAQFFSGQKPLKNLSFYGGTGLDMMPSENAVVFVDNHDTQRASGILTYKNETIYKAALAFLLAHPYGQARITSSFYFTDFDEGPPANADESIKGPVINSNNQCTQESGWVCEHRWDTVARMVRFRNEVHKTQVANWWDNGNNQIAFSLDNKGFIAFNLEGTAMNTTLQTGLPAGTYCDIRSGKVQGTTCSGKIVAVSNTGQAIVTLSADELYLAVHVGTDSSLQTFL
ncbi:hypothetical protein PYW08_004358 [Mythimna loreyi]|uniref:Uncharacterized protein n=1 Tax=Mythimna loreyi TaxID=667449 RepID=A0ACC2QTT8_9NEOP|nr:hypothetical protein PYW08_004358 [Mythimna loreyi]